MSSADDDHDHRHEREPRGDRGVDPGLASVVQLADSYGIEQQLVLTLAGQVVEGTLIGGRRYFADLAVAVQGGDSDDTMRGALAASLRRRGEDVEEQAVGTRLGDLDPEGPEHDDLAPMVPVAWLHLRDASVVTWPRSGQRLPLWRGRLADVVGWSVGSFEDDPAD